MSCRIIRFNQPYEGPSHFFICEGSHVRHIGYHDYCSTNLPMHDFKEMAYPKGTPLPECLETLLKVPMGKSKHCFDPRALIAFNMAWEQKKYTLYTSKWEVKK